MYNKVFENFFLAKVICVTICHTHMIFLPVLTAYCMDSSQIMTEATTYFNTPSEEWNFLGYYKHRRNENNFTFSFRKESFLLKKNLESRQKILKAKQLLEAFKVNSFLFFA